MLLCITHHPSRLHTSHQLTNNSNAHNYSPYFNLADDITNILRSLHDITSRLDNLTNMVSALTNCVDAIDNCTKSISTDINLMNSGNDWNLPSHGQRFPGNNDDRNMDFDDDEK